MVVLRIRRSDSYGATARAAVWTFPFPIVGGGIQPTTLGATGISRPPKELIYATRATGQSSHAVRTTLWRHHCRAEHHQQCHRGYQRQRHRCLLHDQWAGVPQQWLDRRRLSVFPGRTGALFRRRYARGIPDRQGRHRLAGGSRRRSNRRRRWPGRWHRPSRHDSDFVISVYSRQNPDKWRNTVDGTASAVRRRGHWHRRSRHWIAGRHWHRGGYWRSRRPRRSWPRPAPAIRRGDVSGNDAGLPAGSWLSPAAAGRISSAGLSSAAARRISSAGLSSAATGWVSLSGTTPAAGTI